MNIPATDGVFMLVRTQRLSYYVSSYPDRKGPLKTMNASYLYKRMTHHHKPLMTGDKNHSTGFTNIIDKYGYGKHVLDGTFTGIPLWLCMLIPRPIFQKNALSVGHLR